VIVIPYVIYAKKMASKFNYFVEDLLSTLAKRGVSISNYRVEGNTVFMSVRYRDETGDMALRPYGEDIQIAYTASGGPEVLKEALKGAALGGGISTVTSIIVGRGSLDQLKSGVAGALAGGAYGAIRGYEKEERERLMFAKLLASAVDYTCRTIDRKIEMRKRKLERLTKEKDRLLAQYEGLKGELESVEADYEARKADAEARYLSAIASIESSNLPDKVKQRKIESEKKKYEAQLLRIEAWKKSRIANIRRKMIQIERRLKKIDEEITKYLPPPPPPPPA